MDGRRCVKHESDYVVPPYPPSELSLNANLAISVLEARRDGVELSEYLGDAPTGNGERCREVRVVFAA